MREIERKKERKIEKIDRNRDTERERSDQRHR